MGTFEEKNSIYVKACDAFSNKNYQEALELFASLDGWLDSNEKIQACKKRIDNPHYDEERQEKQQKSKKFAERNDKARQQLFPKKQKPRTTSSASLELSESGEKHSHKSNKKLLLISGVGFAGVVIVLLTILIAKSTSSKPKNTVPTPSTLSELEEASVEAPHAEPTLSDDISSKEAYRIAKVQGDDGGWYRRYFYNALGQLSSTETWLVNLDGSEYLSGKETFDYDDSGRLLRQTSYEGDYPYSILTFTYSTNDPAQIQKRESTSMLGSSMLTEYEYNETGQLVAEINYTSDGEVIGYDTYRYDENGQLVAREERSYGEDPYYVEYYSYDLDGNLARVDYVPLVEWYSCSADYKVLEYDYLSRLIRETYYTADGSLTTGGCTYEYSQTEYTESELTENSTIEFGDYYCKVLIPSDWEGKVYLQEEDLGVFSVRYSYLEWPDDLLLVIQVEPMVPTDFTDDSFTPTIYQSSWFGTIYSLCVDISEDAIIYAGYPAAPKSEESVYTKEYNEMLKLVPDIVKTAHTVPEMMPDFWEYYYFDEIPEETAYYIDAPVITSGEFYLQSAYDGLYLGCSEVKNNERTGKSGYYLSLVYDKDQAIIFTPVSVDGDTVLLYAENIAGYYYLDAWTSSRAGAGVDLWTEGNPDDQRWIISMEADCQYIIYLKSNPLYMLLNETATDGDSVSIGTRTYDERQWWYAVSPGY